MFYFNRVKLLFLCMSILTICSCQNKKEDMNIKDKELETLVCDGPVDIYNVSVKGSVSIDGKLTANGFKVQGPVGVDGSVKLNGVDLKSDLTVDGNLNLNKGVVLGRIEVDGSADLNELDLRNELFVDGPLVLNKCTVSGEIELDGSAKLNEVELKNNLIVEGSLEIIKGIVLGKIEVYGSVDIKECKIKDLVVCGGKTTIEFSTVKSIRIIKMSESEIFLRKKQTITLISSKVEGDIVFDGGCGEVVLRSGATVAGKIIGGNLVNN